MMGAHTECGEGKKAFQKEKVLEVSLKECLGTSRWAVNRWKGMEV